MGKLRLDIVNDKMVRVLRVTEKVDNGAFGYVTNLRNVDDLGRETYELKKFDGTNAGSIVFVAHDGHRYEGVGMTSTPSLMRKPNPNVTYYEVKNDGFDVVVDPDVEDGITRGYKAYEMDMISVEPHVLLGGEKVMTLEDAKAKVQAGDLLAPSNGTYHLEKTSDFGKAIAQVDGVELWCGYPVVVIRFL